MVKSPLFLFTEQHENYVLNIVMKSIHKIKLKCYTLKVLI